MEEGVPGSYRNRQKQIGNRGVFLCAHPRRLAQSICVRNGGQDGPFHQMDMAVFNPGQVDGKTIESRA